MFQLVLGGQLKIHVYNNPAVDTEIYLPYGFIFAWNHLSGIVQFCRLGGSDLVEISSSETKGYTQGGWGKIKITATGLNVVVLSN